ncbi:MAG: mechanosensitive ion channel family protein [Candidatus Methanofastidiosia archaeon]
MAINPDAPLREIVDKVRVYFNNDYLFAIFILVVFLLLSKIISLIYKKLFLKIAQKTKTTVDNQIVEATEKPVIYFVLTIGAKAVISAIDLEGSAIATINNILSSLMIIIFALIIIKSIDILINDWGKKWLAKTRSKYGDTLFPMARRMIKILIYIFALIVILDMWGVKVAPLLAGMGIAGLAVGFAVQDSLKDMISGVNLMLDKAYKVGDKVKIDTGETGIIYDISLRSTRIRTYDNNVIIIPNSKMASSKIINYAQPRSRERGQIPFGVIYGSNVEKTRKAALEALKSVEGILEDPPPAVEFLELADSSLNFRALFWVESFEVKWGVERAVVQKIYEKLNEEGIEIAFPTRTLHIYQHELNEN